MHPKGSTPFPRIEIACESCGNPFISRQRSDSQTGRARFCSQPCYHRGRITPVVDRFWLRVNKTAKCWLWTDDPGVSGYGNLFVSQTIGQAQAHRFAWEMASGETLTDRDVICHTCDIKLCVRHDDRGVYAVDGMEYPRWGHLFKATHAVNVADRVQKGRTRTGHLQGERHGMAKLTEADARTIIELLAGGARTTDIAKTYRVRRQTIYEIRTGRRWGHLHTQQEE